MNLNKTWVEFTFDPRSSHKTIEQDKLKELENLIKNFEESNKLQKDQFEFLIFFTPNFVHQAVTKCHG